MAHIIKKPNNLSYSIFFCTLLVLIGLTGYITIDMYVPAMPGIANDLNISMTAIQLTISLYLIPCALGQLIYGPLSDCFGRKKVLLPAMLLGLIGSFCCAFGSEKSVFYMGRILQGLGFSAIGAIIPAMARDVFDDKRFAQIGSILSLVFGLGPIFSPIIGSYVGHLFGWHMIFIVMTLYATVTFLLGCLFIQETHEASRRAIFHTKPIILTYLSILRDRNFLKNALCKSIAYTGFIVFYTLTPFMLQDQLHISAINYGWITLTITGGILFSKFINTLVLEYISIHRIIYLSIWGLAFASLILLVFGLVGFYSVSTIIIPFVIFGIGSGFLFSNTTVAAFGSFKKMFSGSIAGLLNGIQLLCAFIGSFIAAHLTITSLLPLALLMSIMSLFMIGQYSWLSKHNHSH